MTIYRLKVAFNETPEIYRLVDIKPEDNLEKLHKIILKSIKFEEGELAAFYLNYKDKLNQVEIPLEEMSEEEDSTEILMRTVKIKDYLKNVNDKLSYVYDFLNMWVLDVELQKKIEKPTAGTKYPAIIKSIGEAPSQFDQDHNLYVDNLSEEDMMMLNDMMSSKKSFRSNDLGLDDEDMKIIGDEFMDFEEDDFHDDHYGGKSYNGYDDDDDY